MKSSLTRRHLLSASSVGATTLFLAACGSSDSSSGSSDRDPADITDQTVRVWFMEGSIADEAIAFLEKKFAEVSEGNTLKVEIQPWDGIVSKLQTSLSSNSESPDLVETGNTQSSTFGSVGAFVLGIWRFGDSTNPVRVALVVGLIGALVALKLVSGGGRATAHEVTR